MHTVLLPSEYAIFHYKVDNKYTNYERGILFNDKDLRINWRIDEKDMIISEKDLKYPEFKNAEVS